MGVGDKVALNGIDQPQPTKIVAFQRQLVTTLVELSTTHTSSSSQLQASALHHACRPLLRLAFMQARILLVGGL